MLRGDTSRGLRLAVGCIVALTSWGCGAPATLPEAAGTGAHPKLPPPAPSLIPVVEIAPAVGWSATDTPTAAPDLAVVRFAERLDHPRWLYALPNGDVLVAETNAPPRPNDGGGPKSWAMHLVMRRTGAATPSANRITLLRDADGDGVADRRSVLLEGLNSPFGMALVGNSLFIATTDRVVRYEYIVGQDRVTAGPKPVADLGEDGNARGRLVGVALDRDGALLVADDVGNVIWRVTAKARP